MVWFLGMHSIKIFYVLHLSKKDGGFPSSVMSPDTQLRTQIAEKSMKTRAFGKLYIYYVGFPIILSKPSYLFI